jgi:putative ABC transport system permease protein
MSLREAAVAALQALVANRMRSLLTTLGVIIGVFAVVLLVAIGQGARDGGHRHHRGTRIEPAVRLAR